MRVTLVLLFLTLCNGLAVYRPAHHDTHALESNRPTISERDQTVPYLVVPRNGTDQSLLPRLEGSIKSVTGSSHIDSWTTDGELMWYSVGLTKTELTALEKNDDIAYMTADPEMEHGEGLSEDLVSNSTNIHHLSPRHLFERDQEYTNQDNAAVELRVISTPPGEDWSCSPEYRYPKEAGRGIFIYHLEDGIQSEYAKEFEGRVEQSLTTPIHNGRPVSPTKHSTCVAEKALGTTYGVAKEARLIPVLLGFVSGSSITQGFKQVIDDLTKDKEDAEKENREPTRYGKSVLIISAATKQTFDQLPLDQRPYTLLRQYLSKLTTMGLPIVAAAGNRADVSTGDVEVKLLPAWYASGQLLPIIDVGAADPEGNIISTSRRGDKVSIYADGKDIQCSAQVQSGTSFTAPQVGGGIAVAMSQTEGPFYEATHGKTGKQFVQAVREFIMTKSSWQRPGGANMYWNMVNWT